MKNQYYHTHFTMTLDNGCEISFNDNLTLAERLKVMSTFGKPNTIAVHTSRCDDTTVMVKTNSIVTFGVDYEAYDYDDTDF